MASWHLYLGKYAKLSSLMGQGKQRIPQAAWLGEELEYGSPDWTSPGYAQKHANITQVLEERSRSWKCNFKKGLCCE
ncbi:hypothetical protein Y1Q_0011657 [Alligator mississippiensis]|uniref:Uncharacterized protein n=1 Tax=Alligator mississippiensis TaxID=8496 RepID=A0A151M0Q7_ALLMI|nr:hypothetical protein Y1Q_0011657 [Alligator mississippiensis]